jgi:hypothetical protein
VEKRTFVILQEIAYDRFLLELASGEELIQIIEQCIQQARPLSELWLVTPDAMPVIDPENCWEHFQPFLNTGELDRYDEFGGIQRPPQQQHHHFLKPNSIHITRSTDALDIIGRGDQTKNRNNDDDAFDYNYRPHTSPGNLNAFEFSASDIGHIDEDAICNGPLPASYPTNFNRMPSKGPGLVVTAGSGASRPGSNNNLKGEMITAGSNNNMTNISSGPPSPSKNSKVKAPKIRNDDEITNYGYLKKLLSTSTMTSDQREHYFANANNPSKGQAALNERLARPVSRQQTSSPSTTAAAGFEGGSESHPELQAKGSSQPGATTAAHQDKNDHGMHENHAHVGSTTSLNRSVSQDSAGSDKHGKRTAPSSSKGRRTSEGHNRPSSSHSNNGVHHRPTSGHTDPKELEHYYNERHVLEEKMMAKRELREKEFAGLGMSIPNAKLAAYNELLIEEQHAWKDFENHYRKVLHNNNSSQSASGNRSTPH